MSLMPTAVFAAEHTHCICGETHTAVGDHTAENKKTWTAWSSTNSLPTAAGCYYLTADVTLTDRWTPASDIFLCLNGHDIISGADRAIIIWNGFTLTDCKGTGKITHIPGKTGCGIQVENSTFNMYGGNITGNEYGYCGGMNVLYSVFNMYGGSITENYATSVSDSNSYSSPGSGVRVESGSDFNMYGGTISNNYTKGNTGGGVYVFGTVYNFKYCKITLSGNAQIKGNMNGVTKDESGNYTGGTECNIYLCKYNAEGNPQLPLLISGTLTGGAGSIGVTTENTPTEPTAESKGFVFLAKGTNNYTLTKTDKLAISPDASTSSTPYYVSLRSDVNELLLNVGTEPHEHEWKYEGASIDGIQAVCANSDGKCDNTDGGTVKVVVPTTDLVYNGLPKKATLSGSFASGLVPVIKYSRQGENAYIWHTLADGEFPTDAGTYEARITAGRSGEGHAHFTISPKEITNPTIEVADGSVYNNGEAVEPAVTVKDGSTVIAPTEYSLSYDNNTNAGTATVTVTNKDGGNYIVNGSKTFTIGQATPNVTVNAINKEYSGAALTASDITGTTSGVAGSWSWKDGAPKNVADSTSSEKTWKVIFTPNDTTNYKTIEKTVDVTITPCKITISGVTAENRDYAAKNTSVTLTGGTLQGVKNADDVTFTLGTGSITDANAGIGKPVTTNITLGGTAAKNYQLTQPTDITVTINKINPSYTVPTGLTATFGQKLSDVSLAAHSGWAWKDPTASVGNVGVNTFNATFTPDDTTNYETMDNIQVSVTVNKATAPAPADITVSHKYSVSGEQSKQIGSVLPADAGTLTYSVGTSTVVGTATVGSFTVDNSGLVKYTVTGGAKNDVITLPVIISSDNYKNITVNIKITLTDKEAQAELFLNGNDTVVFGNTLSFTTSGGSGTGAVTYSVTNGSGEATIDADGILTPTKVGTVTVKATKAGDDDYTEISSADKTVTITQAIPSGEPKYTQITSDGKTLADAKLTTEGGTFSVSGTVKWVDENGGELAGTTVVTDGTSYKWLFTPASSDYATLSGYIVLYHAATDTGRPVGGGTIRYTVSFESNGGSGVASQTVVKNNTAEEPPAPTKENFVFAGWYTDKNFSQVYDFSDKVTKSFTLYAKWKEAQPTPDDSDKPGSPTAIKWENPFGDVSENNWFFENVRYVVQNKLFSGTSANKFEPNMPITRGMLVTVLYRAEGEPAVNKSIPFADVKASDYFANAVIWAEDNNIVTGISETEFAPNRNVTREQFAAIMYRYAKYKGYDVPTGENTNILSYTDAKSISEYATTAMQYAIGTGLITGKTQNTINPKDYATRAESAAILQRFYDGNK